MVTLHTLSDPWDLSSAIGLERKDASVHHIVHALASYTNVRRECARVVMHATKIHMFHLTVRSVVTDKAEYSVLHALPYMREWSRAGG